MQRVMEFRGAYSKQLERAINKVLEEYPQWDIDKIAMSSAGYELAAIVVFKKHDEAETEIIERD